MCSCRILLTSSQIFRIPSRTCTRFNIGFCSHENKRWSQLSVDLFSSREHTVSLEYYKCYRTLAFAMIPVCCLDPYCCFFSLHSFPFGLTARRARYVPSPRFQLKLASGSFFCSLCRHVLLFQPAQCFCVTISSKPTKNTSTTSPTSSLLHLSCARSVSLSSFVGTCHWRHEAKFASTVSQFSSSSSAEAATNLRRLSIRCSLWVRSSVEDDDDDVFDPVRDFFSSVGCVLARIVPPLSQGHHRVTRRDVRSQHLDHKTHWVAKSLCSSKTYLPSRLKPVGLTKETTFSLKKNARSTHKCCACNVLLFHVPKFVVNSSVSGSDRHCEAPFVLQQCCVLTCNG